MAEVSRTDAAERNLRQPTDAPNVREFAREPRHESPELPESASLAGNAALNRSAEVVGRGVGTAVAGVRRLPQQFGKLRSRIHLVPRRDAAAAVSEIRDSAVEAALDWRDAAEETAAELKARAETYTREAAERTNRTLEDLQREAAWRVDGLRRGVRAWLATARQWKAEQPLRTIAGCAAIAFVAGIALRVWRSGHE